MGEAKLIRMATAISEYTVSSMLRETVHSAAESINQAVLSVETLPWIPLTVTFANPVRTAFLTPEQAKGEAVAAQWTCGQVPPLEPMVEGVDRKDPQLAYARTLLTVFQEAVNQLAPVVENLEQIQVERGAASSADPLRAPTQEQPQDKNQAAETGKQQQDPHQ